MVSELDRKAYAHEEAFWEERRRLAQDITEEEHWIQHCGGTLEGYREHYGTDQGVNPDDIYAADMGALQELYDRYHLGLSRHEAKVRQALGDGYFD